MRELLVLGFFDPRNVAVVPTWLMPLNTPLAEKEQRVNAVLEDVKARADLEDQPGIGSPRSLLPSD